MTCQRCGKRDATVHLVELVDGQRKSMWLCDVCAGRPQQNGDDEPGFRFPGSPEGPGDDEESATLASFLGQVFQPQEKASRTDPPVCAACGYTLEQFRKSNRLGCPQCYHTFRGSLLAILSHLHRHVSHLGKVPRPVAGRTDLIGLLRRTRIALEKAIAAEDFEKAARLRDEIQRLESAILSEGDHGP
jgi:protein arginine kinase activator